MGYDARIIFLLFYQFLITKVCSDCSGVFSTYENAGLSPLTSPPYKPGEEVFYRCDTGREVPGYSSIYSTCIDNR